MTLTGGKLGFFLTRPAALLLLIAAAAFLFAPLIRGALALAVELSGKPAPAIVPIEAATVICNHMLQEHGVVTVTSVGMPGAAPMVRTMMFPDGLRLGLEGVMAALEGGIARLQEVLDQPEAARRVIMGPEGRP